MFVQFSAITRNVSPVQWWMAFLTFLKLVIFLKCLRAAEKKKGIVYLVSVYKKRQGGHRKDITPQEFLLSIIQPDNLVLVN